MNAALLKFLPLTAWKLSMVGLDNQQQDAFVHAPVRVVVDLKRTRCTPVDLLGDGAGSTDYCGTDDEHQVALLLRRHGSDSVSFRHTQPRGPPSSSRCAPRGWHPDVEVQDGGGCRCCLGAHNIEQCRSRTGQPLLFLNIAAKYNGDLELNLWHARLVDHECPCARMTQLKDLAAEEHFAQDREQVTTKHEDTWDPDHASQVLTGEALLSCCAFLEMASEDPNAAVP